MNKHTLYLRDIKTVPVLSSNIDRRKLRRTVRVAKEKRTVLTHRKRKILHTKKWWIWLSAVSLVLVATLILLLFIPIGEWLQMNEDENRFAKGICVNGLDISGLTTVEAHELLMPIDQERLENAEISFVFNGETYVKTAADLGITTNLESVLLSAMQADKNSNFLLGLKTKADIKRNGRVFQTCLTAEETSVSKAIADMADDFYSAPIEPMMIFDENAGNGEYVHWEDGVYGIALDEQNLCDKIIQQISEGTYDLGAIGAISIPTQNTVEMLCESVVKISEYTTSFYGATLSEENRINNIIKMSGILNGTVIEAGEEWSFNNSSGERTEASGWQMASTLYGGVLVEEVGGGLCQVSSTVYNAFLLAEVGIVERHAHSRPSSYVPIGLDATVDYGVKDLKIKNTLNDTIYLVVKVDKESKTITALVYGPKPSHDYQVIVRALIWQSNIEPEEPASTVVAEGGFAPDGTYVTPGTTYAYPETTLGSRYKTYRYYYPMDYDEENDDPYSWIGYIKGENASGEKCAVQFFTEDGSGKDIITYYPPLAGKYYINPED